SLDLPAVTVVARREQEQPLTRADQGQHSHVRERNDYRPIKRGLAGDCPPLDALAHRTPPHRVRTPSAIVTRPANTNAVWRNEASRSKGSSAETASRGITTAYQRSAALAAVYCTPMFATVPQITRVSILQSRSRWSSGVS